MAAVKWNLVVLRLYYGHTRGACGSPELRAQRGKSVLNVIARRILKLSGRVNTLPQRQWKAKGGGVYEWFWNTSSSGSRGGKGNMQGARQGLMSKLRVG